MKYITVKLTEDQAYQVWTSLENDWIDNENKAYISRIITKIKKALVQAKS